jgi:hypothetical protein
MYTEAINEFFKNKLSSSSKVSSSSNEEFIVYNNEVYIIGDSMLRCVSGTISEGTLRISINAILRDEARNLRSGISEDELIAIVNNYGNLVYHQNAHRYDSDNAWLITDLNDIKKITNNTKNNFTYYLVDQDTEDMYGEDVEDEEVEDEETDKPPVPKEIRRGAKHQPVPVGGEMYSFRFAPYPPQPIHHQRYSSVKLKPLDELQKEYKELRKKDGIEYKYIGGAGLKETFDNIYGKLTSSDTKLVPTEQKAEEESKIKDDIKITINKYLK